MAKPTVLVDRDAEAYVRAVVDAVDAEVGGLAYAQRLENGDFFVYEFVVLPQTVSSAEVEFEDEGMHAYLAKAADRKDFENLRCSWHSHGNMSTYYSATDTGDAIEKYKGAGTPFLLSMVYNRKGEVKTRLDIFDSAAIEHTWLEDLDYAVMAPRNITEQAQADVKENVSMRKYKYQQKGSSRIHRAGMWMDEDYWDEFIAKAPKGQSFKEWHAENEQAEKDADSKETDDRKRSAQMGGRTMVVYEGGRRKEFRNGHELSDEPYSPGTKAQKRRDDARRRKAMEADPEDRAEQLMAFGRTMTHEEFARLDDTPINELSDEEYMIYAGALGLVPDETTRRLLAGGSGEANDRRIK